MLFDPQYPIFLYPDHVDMRKGHNTLSFIVIQKMNLDCKSSSYHVFKILKTWPILLASSIKMRRRIYGIGKSKEKIIDL